MNLKKRRLEVKRYWSPDINDPWGWDPENSDVFYLLEMDIGLNNEDAADVYSVIIATPEGINALRDKNRGLDRMYKLLLLENYSWKKVVSIINSILDGVDISDNYRISLALCRHLYWEYESMK